MKPYWKSVVLAATLGVSFIGCSKEPTAVGSKLFPNGEKFAAHDTTLSALGDTTTRVAPVNGSGFNVLVGNQSSIDCKALLRFDVTIPESLTTVQIDTARLSLTVNYSWNAASLITPASPATPATFDIDEVTTLWSAASVTADSLSSLSLAPTNSMPITVTSQDTFTVGKILTAQIDKHLLRKWIAISADTADTLTSRFFSIAVVTHPGLTNVGIWGFTQFGTSTPPSLVVIYEKNGVKDSVTFNTGEDTFLATGGLLPSPDYIEVQGGISIRSRVRFSMKPVSDSTNKVIVNNATMQLTLNNSASALGNSTEDSLLAFFSGSDAFPDSIQPASFAYGYRQDTSQTNSVYVFNLTTMAQQWINSPSNNFGVALRSLNDYSSVDKLVFYSIKSPTKAPKIVVTYTKR